MAKRSMSPIERAEAKIFEMSGEPNPEETEAAPPEEPKTEAPAEPEPVKPPLAEKKPSPKDPEEETLAQRFKSLQGMHKGYIEKIDALTDQNRLLMERLAAQKVETPADGVVLPSGASQAELAKHVARLNEEYGDEFATILRGFLQHETSSMIDQRLNQRLKPVEEKLEKNASDAETLRRSTFKRELTSHVGDWEDIYSSDEFETWLSTHKEEFTGQTYQDLFVDANNRWDMTAMVKFFNAYKQATGRSPKESSDPPAPRGQDPRQELVAPGKSNASSNTPQATGQKKIWSLQEVNAFYKDVQTGKYVGREDEANRIDNEIFIANREDRIRR